MSDTNTPVAADTDDLDAFSAEFFGQSTEQKDEAPLTPEPEVKPEEAEVKPDPVEDAPTPEDDALEDEPEPEVKPRKQTAQERIRELNARAKEAERRETEMAAEVERLRQLVEGKKEEPRPEVTPTAVAEGAPSPEDLNEDGTDKYPLGEYDPKYIRDLTRYTIKAERDAEDARKAEEAKAAEAEAAQQALTAEWTEKLVKAQETYPDLKERIETLDDTFVDLEPTYGEFLASTVMSMDFGPDVLYYLANNIEEAQRIVASGPTKAVIALGRLEAKFASSSEVKPSKVSAAPPPPPTNRGSAPAVGAVPVDTDDLEAFSAMYFNKKAR